MKIWGILFILSSIIPTWLGFDKIINYENPVGMTTSFETSSSFVTQQNSVNAYVGGDAYNFIINSNYFTGYMVLALILVLIGSTLLICGYVKENKE